MRRYFDKVQLFIESNVNGRLFTGATSTRIDLLLEAPEVLKILEETVHSDFLRRVVEKFSPLRMGFEIDIKIFGWGYEILTILESGELENVRKTGFIDLESVVSAVKEMINKQLEEQDTE